MVQCNQQLLNDFSFDHYYFINQIFGDGSTRDIIQETFPNKNFKLIAQKGTGEFSGTFHHVVRVVRTGKNICSIADGHQNMEVNVHDTLCQSYALFVYLEQNLLGEISSDAITRQFQMIDMYEKLLSNDTFLKKFKDDLLHKGNTAWKLKNKKNMCREMTDDEIIAKIRKVLNEWRTYGYWHFIGEGKCPIEGGTCKKTKRKVKNPKNIKNKSYRVR